MAVTEIAFAIQSAKGTPAASSTERLYLIAGEVPNAPKVPVPAISTSTTRIALSSYVSSIRPIGAFRAYVRPEAIGAMLYAVLGAKAVTGASDPRTHTFTLGASLPYLTFWRHYGGFLNERISDVRVSRLTITGQAGKPLEVWADLVGGSMVYRTAQETTAAVEQIDTFLFRHGAGALKLEGTAVSSISSFTLVVEAGVTVVETLSGPLPFLNGKAVISLQCEQALVDASLWNRLLYGTASPANLAVPTLTPLELAGSPAGVEFLFTEQASPERSLKLAIPRVVLMPPSFAADPSFKPSRQQLSLQALAPSGGVSPLTATLKNALTGY